MSAELLFKQMVGGFGAQRKSSVSCESEMTWLSCYKFSLKSEFSFLKLLTNEKKKYMITISGIITDIEAIIIKIIVVKLRLAGTAFVYK